MELKVLRLRLQQGRDNKAKRGEYYPLLPPGYVRNEAEQVVKDPNLRVQRSISEIFEKFREIGSIRQTFLWFRDSKVELPVNKVLGGKHKLVFQHPTHSFIRGVLRNPFYAGAYVWGQRPMKVVVEGGVATRRQQASPCPPEQAKVFIRDHHEGYIGWDTYEENLEIIRRNDFHTGGGETPGAVRSGLGLLVGLLRCGHCGRRIYVRYSGKKGTHARYLCSGTYVIGGAYCLGFAGRTTDRRVSEEILQVLSGHGVRASLEAMARLDAEQGERTKLERLRLEQLQFEVTRAFEQYDEVDPRNRLVAQELERRWNEKLQELEQARAELVKNEARHRSATDEERQRLAALGANFESVWNHPACSNELKKKIIRAVLEEAVVREEPKGKLEFVLHWKGGTHTTFTIDKPINPGQGKTAPEDLEIIGKMAPTYGDIEIARVLNRLGRRTAKGNRWNRVRVKGIRSSYGITGHDKTPDKPGILSLNGAARHCGVSDTTIKRLVEAKLLPMKQVVPCAAWEIERADLDAEPIKSIIAHLERTGRLVLEGDTLGSQEDLFSTKSRR